MAKDYEIRAVAIGDYDNVPLPQKASAGSAGYDLATIEDLTFDEAGVYTVHTGLSFEIPGDLCALILPRSSMHMHGLTLANQVGLIDSDYRGEILLKVQHDGLDYKITGKVLHLKKGTRLAQLLFLETASTYIKLSQALSSTPRGKGSFGSSGK